MSGLVANIVVVVVIVLIGGFFAAAEMALVSLREGQARHLARRGRRGKRAAKLAADPNRFLSAVQIGVTLATLVSGVYGAATLAGILKAALVSDRLSPSVASPLSFVLVTVGITFVTLVLGELAPKRFALQRAEGVSLVAAPILDRISVLARPVVWLLSKSTNLVVALLGADPRMSREVMTEQELRDLIVGYPGISLDERRIVGEVFDAGKRQIREVLLPRTEVEFLAADTPLPAAAALVAQVPYSRLPVYRDSYDDVIGFVHVRDLLDPGTVNRAVPVGRVCRPVKFLPTSKTVLSALSEMRADRAHLAIVVDEYGGTAGIVTLEDLVEELIGDIRDEYDVEQGQPKLLRGGEVEVDGLLNLHEFGEQTGIDLPEGPYETAAGYLLARLGQVPAKGQSVEVAGRRLTVTELDGRRIARLRVAPATAPAAPPDHRRTAGGGVAGRDADGRTVRGRASGGRDDGPPPPAAT